MLLASEPARADLGDDAARLVRLWSLRGAEVTRQVPLFLEHGRARTIATPAAAGGECLTVAFLSARTAEFAVGSADAPRAEVPPRVPLAPRGAAEPDLRLRSAGGAAVISRCGAGRADLARLTVEMASARAALEIVVARSDAPLGELREVLPERAAGPVAPRGDPGGPLEPGPLADRLTRAERRARLDGAAQVTRVSARASARGVGEVGLRLAEGCHRVEVMAEVPTGYPHRGTDIDAEAHERSTGKLLARDRADVPDARLDFCLGEATVVSIPFVGAAGAVAVTVLDARWLVPTHVPSRWGARARAGFAGALHRRHAPSPSAEPIAESLGVQGLTSIPIEVEPGRCYLAAVAIMRGEARTLRLAVALGDRTAHDAVNERPEGAALAFCVDAARSVQSVPSVQIDVELRGNGPWWALSVWPMGAAAP